MMRARLCSVQQKSGMKACILLCKICGITRFKRIVRSSFWLQFTSSCCGPSACITRPLIASPENSICLSRLLTFSFS